MNFKLMVYVYTLKPIFYPAPSAAPASVNVSALNYSSIIVHWRTVDCVQRNGDITGYLVRYWEVEGGGREGESDTKTAPGDETRRITLTGLAPLTEYSVEVAAVNRAGVGVYSSLLRTVTHSNAVVAT